MQKEVSRERPGRREGKSREVGVKEREKGRRKTRIRKVPGGVDLASSHHPQGTSFLSAWRVDGSSGVVCSPELLKRSEEGGGGTGLLCTVSHFTNP